MRGHECYHCKQWIDEGVEHDCWTTTEAALTRELSEELRDAWERLRETAADFGEQRIYASHKSIMFSRRACYFFVRPRRRDLEVTFFVGRLLKSGRIRRSDRTSQRKIAHVVLVTHRDEVEAPFTDWLQEAYEFAGAAPATPKAGTKKKTAKKKTATKPRLKSASSKGAKKTARRS
jgi:Domain of unknown function (DUF5655)